MKITKNPLISIIVPVYNGQKYLSECINSILNQDYKNIEVIIVNDGSKDDSPKIIDEYAKKDKRVKAIHQENGGVSSARNNGIDNANGEYITFIDADDYVESDYIKYLCNLIVDNNADVSLTPFPNKVTQNSKKINSQIEDYIVIWSGEEAMKNMLYYKVVISSWNKMFRSKLLMENKIKFNQNLSFGEGFDFTIASFQCSRKVAVGHKKVYNYRVDNASSVMTKFSEKLVTGSIDAQKNIKNSFITPNKSVNNAWKYSNWHTHCDCLNTIVGCNVKKQCEVLYKNLKKVCRNDAFCVIDAPISKKEKMKGILYFISPYFAAKIINHFRLRKFTVE